MSSSAVTAEQLIRNAARAFAKAGLHFGHGTNNATDEAAWLVLHALGLPFDAPARAQRQPVAPAKLRHVRELIAARIETRQPAAYLTGEAWFAGLRFKADARALVPRSSFAELILNRFQPWLSRTPAGILDLCTGGGCIAIACANAFPKARVDASDVSADALALAQENVRLHRLGKRLRLFESDLFERVPRKKYELIVSNPPYVGAREMRSLPAEYRHEPHMGLEAPENGLALVRRMLEQAPDYLTEHGILLVEVGNSDAAVAKRWPDLPLTWLDFEHSEGGVFIIAAPELREWNRKRVWK